MTPFLTGVLVGMAALFALCLAVAPALRKRQRNTRPAYRIWIDLIPPENMRSERAEKFALEFAEHLAHELGMSCPPAVTRFHVRRSTVAEARPD